MHPLSCKGGRSEAARSAAQARKCVAKGEVEARCGRRAKCLHLRLLPDVMRNKD